jgi:hypothetical protein
MRLDILIGSAVCTGIGLAFILFRVRIADTANKLIRISYGDLFPDRPLPALFIVMGVGCLVISAILLLRGLGVWP